MWKEWFFFLIVIPGSYILSPHKHWHPGTSLCAWQDCCRPVQRVKQVNLTYNEAAFSVIFTFYLLLVLLMSCCCAWPSAASAREVSEQILNQGLVQDPSLFFCPKPVQILELPVKMLNSNHLDWHARQSKPVLKKIQRNVISIRMNWIVTFYLISSCPPFVGRDSNCALCSFWQGRIINSCRKMNRAERSKNGIQDILPEIPEIDGEKMITGSCFVTQFPTVTAWNFKSNNSSFSTPAVTSVHSCTGGLLILICCVLHGHLRIQHHEYEGSTE